MRGNEILRVFVVYNVGALRVGFLFSLGFVCVEFRRRLCFCGVRSRVVGDVGCFGNCGGFSEGIWGIRKVLVIFLGVGDSGVFII